MGHFHFSAPFIHVQISSTTGYKFPRTPSSFGRGSEYQNRVADRSQLSSFVPHWDSLLILTPRLSLYKCVYACTPLYFCLFICMSYPSNRPSFSPSVYPSVCLSVCLRHLSFCRLSVSVCLPVRPSVHTYYIISEIYVDVHSFRIP